MIYWLHKWNKQYSSSNAKHLDIVMPMCNLIQYSNNYSKTWGTLWPCYRDDPNYNITESESFKSKIKITGETLNDDNKKMLR